VLVLRRAALAGRRARPRPGSGLGSRTGSGSGRSGPGPGARTRPGVVALSPDLEAAAVQFEVVHAVEGVLHAAAVGKLDEALAGARGVRVGVRDLAGLAEEVLEILKWDEVNVIHGDRWGRFVVPFFRGIFLNISP
jgi:hypothetical protein